MMDIGEHQIERPDGVYGRIGKGFFGVPKPIDARSQVLELFGREPSDGPQFYPLPLGTQCRGRPSQPPPMATAPRISRFFCLRQSRS